MSEEAKLNIVVKVDDEEKIGEFDNFEGRYVQRIQVDQQLDAPDFFSVQFQTTEQNEDKVLDKLKPGAKIEIQIGYGTAETVFKGEVSYIEPHFDANKAWVSLAGYDYTHRLTRGTDSKAWGDGHKKDQSPGTILEDVVGASKARKGDNSDGLSAQKPSTTSELPYVAQYNTNDYQFIQQVIGSFGGGWDAGSHSDPKALSLKAIEAGSVVRKICRDKYNPESESQALSADFRMSTVKQPARVEVRGWDPVKKEGINGFKETPSSFIGEGEKGHETAGKAHYGSASSGRVVTIVDIPVKSKGEAEEIAQSIFDKLSYDFMTGDVVIAGVPAIHAGVIVEMDGFGKSFSGQFLVEGCQHVYVGGKYRSYLKLCRNKAPAT